MKENKRLFNKSNSISFACPERYYDILQANGRQVVGVVQDMYIDSPLLPVLPSVYGIHDPQPGS